VGYLSGLHFIKANLDGPTLLSTASLVHLLDAILCSLIAGQSGRNRKAWTAAGLVLGIWALAALFLISDKKPRGN
jgi:hypothetical protein